MLYAGHDNMFEMSDMFIAGKFVNEIGILPIGNLGIDDEVGFLSRPKRDSLAKKSTGKLYLITCRRNIMYHKQKLFRSQIRVCVA